MSFLNIFHYYIIVLFDFVLVITSQVIIRVCHKVKSYLDKV